MSERQHTDSTDENTSTSNHPAQNKGGTLGEEDYVAQTQKYERAPEDFQADTPEEDLQVPDYAVVVDVGDYGQASAYLASWGLIEDLQQNQGEEVTMNAQRVAEIIKTHYVSPSFDGLNADKVRGMMIDVPDKYLAAIMPGMDTEVKKDGSATVQSKTGK